MPLVVARHLRFAWLEYEDSRDAVAFARSFTSLLGWTNLFDDLLPWPDGVIDVSAQFPRLKILWTSDPAKPNEKALVCFPDGPYNPILEEWLVNPGVDRNRHTLERHNATSYADLLAISGHGGGGMVWGSAASPLRVADAYAIDQTPPSVAPTKYLLMPTCGNCGDFIAQAWLPAFRRPDPLHGILGYAEQYNGGGTGAAIMAKWANIVRSNPSDTVLETWAKANAGYKWGAIIHKQAVTADTIEKWHSAAGLGKVDSTQPVLHFDKTNFPAGRIVTDSTPAVDVLFVAADGTNITRNNNSPLHQPASARRHLRPGTPGGLRFVPQAPLAAGDQVTLVFYWIRRDKPDMNLDALLEFPANYLTPDPSLGFPRIVKLVDANPYKLGGQGRVDGLTYTVIQGEEAGTVIPLTVRANAKTYFKDIHNGSHGFFWMDVYPPGGRPRSTTAVNAAYLV